jgi:cephalosporin hydroxylase
MSIAPFQNKKEISRLLSILQKREPKIILEIGTAHGGTFFLFCQVAHKKSKIISVDLPGGQFGGGYPEWKSPLYRSFRRERQQIYLIREDSHKKNTLESIKDIVVGNKIDFLFLDGDHTYNGIKKDFEFYSPMVMSGGMIAFHNIIKKDDFGESEIH